MQSKVLWRALIAMLLAILMSPPIKSAYFDAGHRWQYILVFSFIATYFLTPFCRTIALKRGIMDDPNWRKVHKRSTPLLGGVAVFLAFCFSLMMNGVYLPGMKSLVVGSLLIFILGLWDDIRPVSSLIRFTCQILISIFVIISGGIYLTLFKQVPGAEILNFVLTILWMVGLTNAMNFFDGIDGLAAGISIICGIFLCIIAFKTGQPAVGWLAVAIVGACAGFMPHNFRFGKSTDIFLGDSGSTFLGFILAGLAVLGEWSKTSDFVSFTSPVLVFGVLIFDMLYVTASRIKNRTGKQGLGILAKANKDHLHHRLLFMGFKRKEAAFTIFTVTTCLGVSALIIMDQKFIDALLGLFQAGLVLAIVAVLMFKGRETTSCEISTGQEGGTLIEFKQTGWREREQRFEIKQ